jgi:hypothetical protein
MIRLERRGLELKSESVTDLEREACQSIGSSLNAIIPIRITMRIMIDHDDDDD